ncbi:MAG: 3-dehydroquinate synthase [Chlamydiia bacterium]|nr:3-dehydroquinate synthase [Chlamydiia bacterium]
MDRNFSYTVTSFLRSVSQRGCRVLLITDRNLASIYAQFLKKLGFEILVIDSGEKVKSRKQKAHIEDYLFKKGFLRNTELIAFGGGVILDLVGFVAATYMRGVNLSLIPTSITAFCDASIGGKNGINTEHGKNLIGNFYTPIEVCLEQSFLSTLSKELYQEQFSEVIKIALTSDKALFFSEDKSLLRARELKEEICRLDLLEKGQRQILNFGHTFAHAYEYLSGFSESHGKAVWKGIYFEALLSHQLGFLSLKDFEQIQQLNIDLTIPFEMSGEELYKAMLLDKKNKEQEPYFVLLKSIGSVLEYEGRFAHPVSKEKIMETYLIYQREGLCAAL